MKQIAHVCNQEFDNGDNILFYIFVRETLVHQKTLLKRSLRNIKAFSFCSLCLNINSFYVQRII